MGLSVYVMNLLQSESRADNYRLHDNMELNKSNLTEKKKKKKKNYKLPELNQTEVNKNGIAVFHIKLINMNMQTFKVHLQQYGLTPLFFASIWTVKMFFFSVDTNFIPYSFIRVAKVFGQFYITFQQCSKKCALKLSKIENKFKINYCRGENQYYPADCIE